MHRLLGSLVSCLALVGCGPTIAQPGSDGDGSESSDSDSDSGSDDATTSGRPNPTDTGESGDPPDPDVPVECGDVEIEDVMPGLGDSHTERSGVDLVVRLSTHRFECGQSFNFPECEDAWSITVTVPPEAQMPGVYSLEEFAVTFSEQTIGPGCDGMGGSTGGGGVSGMLEIYIVNGACIAGSIRNAPILASEGEFVAERC